MTFNFTKDQLYAIAAAAGVGLLWLLNRKPAPGRNSSELVIDANVMSPTFGLPIDGADVVDTSDNGHQRMLDLIDQSNRAIAEFDASHPQGDTP